MAHATTTKIAEEPDTVVIGIVPIFCHLVFTLFDSGATHSFISEKFVEFANLELESLEYTLTMSTLANKYLTTTHKVKGSSVIVIGRNL